MSPDQPFDFSDENIPFSDQIPIEKIREQNPVTDFPQPSSQVSADQLEIIQPIAEGAPEVVKRRPGAPRGNLNALKHGLYIENHSLRNITPIERAQLMDFNDIITHFKSYMDATYEKGLKAKTLAEYNETMRSLSMGLLALSRSVVVQNNFSYFSLPEKLAKRKNLTGDEIVEYYTKKLIVFPQVFQAASGDNLEP